MATIEAIASGAKTSREKLPKMISSVKRAAATGVLYAQAMPAAIPQPARILRSRVRAPSRLPAREATVAESSTIGPSRPTAPAEATVACEEAQFTTVRAQVEHANPQDDRFQDGPTA